MQAWAGTKTCSSAPAALQASLGPGMAAGQSEQRVQTCLLHAGLQPAGASPGSSSSGWQHPASSEGLPSSPSGSMPSDRILQAAEPSSGSYFDFLHVLGMFGKGKMPDTGPAVDISPSASPSTSPQSGSPPAKQRAAALAVLGVEAQPISAALPGQPASQGLHDQPSLHYHQAASAQQAQQQQQEPRAEETGVAEAAEDQSDAAEPAQAEAMDILSDLAPAELADTSARPLLSSQADRSSGAQLRVSLEERCSLPHRPTGINTGCALLHAALVTGSCCTPELCENVRLAAVANGRLPELNHWFLQTAYPRSTLAGDTLSNMQEP